MTGGIKLAQALSLKHFSNVWAEIRMSKQRGRCSLAAVTNFLMISPHPFLPHSKCSECIFKTWISSCHFSAQNSSKRQVTSYRALQGSAWDLAPTSLCSVVWSHNSYSTLSTLLPHTPLSHFSNSICLPWPTVEPVYTLIMLCLCVVCV